MFGLRPLIFTLLLTVGCASSQKTSEQAYSGVGAESVSKETLNKYAPEELPTELASRIERVMDVQSPGSGLLSKNAKQLFFSWRVSGTSQIWRLDGPGGFPIQMTAGNDSNGIEDISPDGKWIVISRDRRGEENPGIYLQPIEGGELIEIQHQKDVQSFFSHFSKDGSALYFRSNDEKKDSYTIYKYDLKSKTKTKLFSGDGYWFLADHNDQGELLLGKATGSRSREYSVFNEKTKKLAPLLGQDESQYYYVAFGPKQGEYIVLTNKFGNFDRLYRYANEKFSPITPEKNMEVDGFQLDEQKRKIAVHWNDQGFTRLEMYDTKDFKPISTPKFKDADHVFLVGFDPTGRYASLAVVTSTEPRSSYVYDFKTNKLSQWVRASAPEVDLSSFSPTTLEFYPAKDGTKIPMLVTRSKTCRAEPCPVIVVFHGGPESQSQPGFIAIYQLFTQAGFHIVRPNVRGSSGYGKEWLDADNGAKRLDVISDIEDAATFIKKNWAKDGKTPKVGVMGGSYGGYSTLMAMTRFAGAYDAGVSMVGMSNLITFLNNTASYRTVLRTTEYGDPVKDKEVLERLSPVTYLDQVKDPLLIIQGASDPRVPVGEAIQMHEKMKAKGLESKLILFADEGHGTSKRENRVLEWGHSLKFFQEHLL